MRMKHLFITASILFGVIYTILNEINKDLSLSKIILKSLPTLCCFSHFVYLFILYRESILYLMILGHFMKAIGDVFMEMRLIDSQYLILGTSMFIIGNISETIFYYRLRKNIIHKNIVVSYSLSGLFIFYIIYIFCDTPQIGCLKDDVILKFAVPFYIISYIVNISNAISERNLQTNNLKINYWNLFIGYNLLIFSDFLIAIDSFVHKMGAFRDILVMFTYWIAIIMVSCSFSIIKPNIQKL